ncbi:MAG: alpha-E domain-containing protein [Verrucomicrobiia bacterium]
MLSRVADSLFWLSRYIERAENTARIVDVNLQMLLDFQRMDDQKIKDHWQSLIKSVDEEDLFNSLYKKPTSDSVTEFLTFHPDNPDSIVSSLSRARENARMVRDQISTEMWEELNRMYLFVRSKQARKQWKSDPYGFYKQIRDGSHLFQGLTDSVYPHDEGWEFIQLGRHIERADKTSRILDVKYHILLPSVRDVGGAVDVVQWSAILRSCSAQEAYHHVYVNSVEPWKVAEFLILSEHFPRSIRFCCQRLDASLRRISKTPEHEFSNEAEKCSGRLLSNLNYSSMDDIFASGLHEYLDSVQRDLNRIGSAIFKTYFFYPATDLENEIRAQQQQQQQTHVSPASAAV